MTRVPASAAPVVGIVGAGQLARMTLQASISLGVSVRLLAAGPDDSAALVAADVRIGSPASREMMARFASGCDVLTFDHELVDAGILAELEAAGRCVRPTADTVALAQDKGRQRALLGGLGFPIPPHRRVRAAHDLLDFAAEQGWPIVVKACRGGYDGRGVWVVDGPAAATELFERAAGGVELLVESWVPIERELAVLVARRPSGEAVTYPAVETVQMDGICHEVLAPAPVRPELAAAAEALALAIADAVGVVGILAVELFVVGDHLIVNELAARPHNSGHYSIEGCLTSQFENHLRAILDWPLGATTLVRPAVATANVLGESEDDLAARLPLALAVPGVRVHLYGKAPRRGRKLGHVTALGEDLGDARERATHAAALLAGRSLATVPR